MSTIERPLLALDTGSPVVSVAVGWGDRILAAREVAQERSAEGLLGLVDDVLREAGVAQRDLGGVVALRGPGSFTGLRVGLATVLGMHQALGLPATALPTLPVLAMLGMSEAESDVRIIAVVDAMRGEWFAQEFAGGDAVPTPLGVERIVTVAEVAEMAPAVLVGFGAERLAAELREHEVLPGAPLAGVALRHAERSAIDWDARLLTAPLYLRPAASTPPSQ